MIVKNYPRIDQGSEYIQHILLVDDEPYNLLSLKMIINMCFKQIGLKTETVTTLIDEACNGQEALDKVKDMHNNKNINYGLIFMDCSMPIMNGYDSSNAIRRFYHSQNILQPKIVAVTGHTEEIYIKKAFEYKIDEVVPKPANVQIVKQIIQEQFVILQV